jgi:rsbT co-antagonist protein RsbR
MPTPDPKTAKALWAVFDLNREAIAAEALKMVAEIPIFAAILKTMTPEQMAAQEAQTRVLQRKAMLENDWAPYEANIRSQGAVYANMGIGFSAWLPLITATRTVLRPLIKKVERPEEVEAGLHDLIDWSLGVLGDAYLAAKEEIITQQQEAIRELSTPVLQLREGMLILPIVGMVDTDRARKLTTSLLEAIRSKRARAVVMDITGVPIVDSKVANHIVQACEAARLMGARVILTGISSDIAQALVGIGAVLHGVQTIGDLQGGIEQADALLGYEVVRRALVQ